MEVRGRITRREFKIVHLVHIFSPSPAAFKYQSTPAHRSKPSIEAALITLTMFRKNFRSAENPNCAYST